MTPHSKSSTFLSPLCHSGPWSSYTQLSCLFLTRQFTSYYYLAPKPPLSPQGLQRQVPAPNQISGPSSDGYGGPWPSEHGAQGACLAGPIGASPQCGASASNARVSQLIVSSRELFFAATEPSRSRRSRDPRGVGGKRRRGRGEPRLLCAGLRVPSRRFLGLEAGVGGG